MGFKSFAEMGRIADTEGFHWAYVTKTTAPWSTNLRFIDVSVSPGIPRYNAYPGSALDATRIIGSGNLGIYPGSFTPGRNKNLMRLQIIQSAGQTPDTAFLLDYLMFYPLVDLDDVGLQAMTNTVTLPRYQSGEGVRIFVVNTAPVTFSGGSMTITYTNSDGVSGRVATGGLIQAGTPAYVLQTAGAGLGSDIVPFFPMANGDRGVRSIESVQCLGSPGGFANLVLAKPIAMINIPEQSTSVEKQFGIFETPPEIFEGSYLNFIVQRNGTAQASYMAELLFMNN